MATRYRRFDMLIFGLKKGEDYEFAKGEKKYVWEKTTFTNIYNTFTEFVKQDRDSHSI